MALVTPGSQLNIPAGENRISVKNESATQTGHCNIFTDAGSENFTLAPSQTKNAQLDGGAARLDNTGKTELLVTYLG